MSQTSSPGFKHKLSVVRKALSKSQQAGAISGFVWRKEKRYNTKFPSGRAHNTTSATANGATRKQIGYNVSRPAGTFSTRHSAAIDASITKNNRAQPTSLEVLSNAGY
jgi:hypothetical protein